MDSHRALKRRKLDGGEIKSTDRPSSSRPPATALSAPKSSSSNKSKGSTSQQLPDGSKGNEVHKAWLDAKAQSNARRGRKLAELPREGDSVDVYDDIEGAHTRQSPFKTKLSHSSPMKRQLDPLRNQKSASSTSSPSKGGSTLGFFKQFQRANPESTPNTPNGKAPVSKIVNGSGSTFAKHARAEVESESSSSSSSSDEEDEQPPPESPFPASTKGNMKGWAYEVPKKTSEDEIRELAEAAKKHADKEENDGAQAGSGQKLRERTKVSQRPTADVAFSPRPNGSSGLFKKAIASEKRKMKEASRIGGAQSQGTSSKNGANIGTLGTPSNTGNERAKPLVLPTHTVTLTEQRSAPLHTTLKEVTFAEAQLTSLQKIVMENLTGKRPNRLMNLDDEYAKVSNLITQTVTAGESNSMLVIGSRGTGKTALVSQILREQSLEHSNDFHVVRLNGFIHTDDKIALREIWRQLGREMELDEEESTSKNLADTLTTLLALLSHPAEHGREETGQVTKSVIFVLDEFELFASHPRQTLLYNLFDIAQSRKAPIVVLGLTTRIDVVESLEKRVKSRFSHRYVHLSSAKSFAAFEEACKSAISIQQNELSTEEREQLHMSSELTAKLQSASKKNAGFVQDWDATIEALMSTGPFQNHLHQLYYTTKSVPDFQASMLLPISTMSVHSETKNIEIIEHLTANLSGPTLRPPDSKLDLLPSLSTLQLALLICAARLTNIHNCDNVPFAQAYEEYKVLASKAKLQASASGALAQGAGSRVWGKDVAKGAWEDLVEFGLVMEDGVRGCRVDLGLEEIAMSGVELGGWGRWCKEI